MRSGQAGASCHPPDPPSVSDAQNSLPDLADRPGSFATSLAANLPGASTFFLTFVTLRGLAGSAGIFIQYSELAAFYAKLFLLGSTPRAVYRIRFGMRSLQWGTVFPDTTLLVVISAWARLLLSHHLKTLTNVRLCPSAIAYSVISPIINGLACVAFILLYFAHKYLFVWVVDQPAWAETGGLFFPKAVDHVFVGLYLEQICLATLFFLARDENGQVSRYRLQWGHLPLLTEFRSTSLQVSAIPQGVLTVVLLVATVSWLARRRARLLVLITHDTRPSSTTFSTTRSDHSRRPCR